MRSRRRSSTAGVTSCSRPGGSGSPARRNGRERRSCVGRCASWSGRWVGRHTSSRSRGKHCEAGSERARRSVSGAGRTRLRRRGGGARPADHPPGDLSNAAAALHGLQRGELVLGSDNGSAFTARRFRGRLAELGIKHRRGGYRDPESQAFIESWFGKLKEREVWLNEYETTDDARRGIGGYVDRYHHRPHSRLDYKTPYEVKETWEDLQNIAA